MSIQWSLVCESKYLSKLAATIYFCGVMVGGLLFGYLADKYGRKPVMLVTLYTPILIGLGTAFSNNYYLYVALRFFMGMFLQVSVQCDSVMNFCGCKFQGCEYS